MANALISSAAVYDNILHVVPSLAKEKTFYPRHVELNAASTGVLPSLRDRHERTANLL